MMHGTTNIKYITYDGKFPLFLEIRLALVVIWSVCPYRGVGSDV